MSKEPLGFINSSFALFFHASVILCAPFFAAYFPSSLGNTPLITCLLTPVLFFWYFWLLKNHTGTGATMVAILGFALVCSFFALVAVIKGPINSEQLPVIPTLNLFFVSYTGSAPILASVVMYYAALSYIAAALLAGIAELLYSLIAVTILPKQFNKKLASADKKIDATLFNFFDASWLMGQSIGSIAILGVLTLFAIIYAITVAAF